MPAFPSTWPPKICRCLGPGQRRSGGRTVPLLRRARPHADTRTSAYHVAGRQYAQGGSRRGTTGSPVSLWRLESAERSGDLAGRLCRVWEIARAVRARRGAAPTIRRSESGDHESSPRLPAQEWHPLQRQSDADGILGFRPSTLSDAESTKTNSGWSLPPWCTILRIYRKTGSPV